MVDLLSRDTSAPALAVPADTAALPAGYRRPAVPQRVEIADAIDCTAEAAHRIGDRDFACGRHRFEVVAAHWHREPGLPVFDLDPGNDHVCNEVRAERREGAS
ncbi:hypothetical protein [Glycomyces artemisiae]|uniref:Uncharacterized protein n=1 Tax=Glycomyces artemisiae TaxID=1076443 RepID=A0A2T0UF90_9ACTN|nr:hypothetical protein [Glycomyces artemisiae]PRY56487.1 hypothetical protein B0I28_109136 [Glycomyces artemisiae]